MRLYKTLETVDLGSGLIGLTDDQSSVRSRSLKKVKKGIHEIMAPVQFKAGEMIKLENPSKAILVKVEDVLKEKEAADKAQNTTGSKN